MSALTWLGLSLAFLGPMPPIRPEPPEPAPPGQPGHAWAATLIMVSLCVITVVPMIAIWSFHRPLAAPRARCEAEGGRWTAIALDGPYRCEHGARDARR